MTTSIGYVYPTAMPDLTDIADIQEALRIYHYGAPAGVGDGFYNPNNTDPTNLLESSVAYHIYNLQYQLDNFTTGVLPSAWTEKGVMISADAPGSPVKLLPGDTNQVLTVNPGTQTGLEWRSLDVGIDNEITILNKTLDIASITNSGLKFLGDVSGGNNFHTMLGIAEPTANRTVTIPNVSGTVITTGNLTDIQGQLNLTAPFTVKTAGNVQTLLITDNVNGNIELGRRDGTASAPYIDFHAGATDTDYDARIMATAGNGVIGQGTLQIQGNLVNNINVTPKTALHVIAPADYNGVVQMNGAFAFNLDTAVTGGAPLGTQVTLVALSAGVSVTAGTGITLLATPGTKFRAANSVATLLNLGTNKWILTGDLTP